MSVRIEEITVRDLGPISDFNMRPGSLNLIYGHNEQGKTYLVEFIIKSLFRNASGWNLRDLSARGRIKVSGITDEVVSFSPSSRHKLEDYWEEADKGFPLNMARLLVIKGAELSIAENEPGGINKAILKEYLSSEMVLDSIQSKISTTIQQSKIGDGIIEGHSRGEIKRWNELVEGLNGINRLFDQIDEVYSGGRRESLNDRLTKLKGSIESMLKAKRYLAYRLDREIVELKEEKRKLPEEELESLKGNFQLYRQKAGEFVRKRKRQEEREKSSSGYTWLEKAIGEYERRADRGEVKSSRAYPTLAILSFVAAAALSFFDVPVGTVIAFVSAGLFGWLYVNQLRGSISRSANVDEIRKISTEFERRFGRELTDIAAMLEIKVEIEEDYHRARSLEEELGEDRKSLESLEDAISDQLYRLTGKKHDRNSWGEAISGIENRLRDLGAQIDRRERELIRLGVDESDYLPEEMNIEYDGSRLSELEAEREETGEQLEGENTKLGNLKQRICQETDDDISIGWEELIEHLREKRGEVVDEYKGQTSEILAKILVNEALEEIREREDEKIRDGLRSDIVKEPLYKITKRYHSIDLEGDQLKISDPYDDFHLSDLSTAAQEQVLLALRIGFASKIAGREGLFLILDDAFQHSDWERREWLLDEVVGLAQQGWQILYLTMDDHIRGLFEGRGRAAFGGEFRFKQLDGK